MRKYGPDFGAGEPAEAKARPRVGRAVVVVVLLAAVGPPAVEGVLVLVAKWAAVAGRTYEPSTPVLDAAVVAARGAARWVDFEASRAFSGGLRKTWMFWPVVAAWGFVASWFLRKTHH